MKIQNDAYPNFNPYQPSGQVWMPSYDIRGVREWPWAKVQALGKEIIQWFRAIGTVKFYYPEFIGANVNYRQKMRIFYRQRFELKKLCARPEEHFQTGWTYAGAETSTFSSGGGADPKERFFYTAYDYPIKHQTPYAKYLFFDKVIPDISGWREAAEEWDHNIRIVRADVCHLIDAGLGWEQGTSEEFTKNAPHLAASTYARFTPEFCMPGAEAAVRHWDLNYCSYHIESDFEGLYGQTGFGYWYPCDLERGWVAAQPAFQLFYRTAGYIPYVPHMVIVDERKRAQINRGIETGEYVDRTVNQHFQHGDLDQDMEPSRKFITNEMDEKRFPRVRVGSFVMRTLQNIGLGAYKNDPIAQELIHQADCIDQYAQAA